MAVILVEPGEVDYEIIITNIIYYSPVGILRVDGHFINRKRTPKRVLDMMNKKRVNRVGLWANTINDLGKLNHIKNKPATMNYWYRDLESAQRFLNRCNVKIKIQQQKLDEGNGNGNESTELAVSTTR